MKKIDKNLLEKLFNEIKNNSQVTEIYLANKYLCTERTIRRYLKILKENNYISLYGYGRKRRWKINKKL